MHIVYTFCSGISQLSRLVKLLPDLLPSSQNEEFRICEFQRNEIHKAFRNRVTSSSDTLLRKAL